MITIAEAISQVKNDVRLVHADRRITHKFIYSLLMKHAALLIKQESDRNKIIKLDDIWQSFCFDLEEVPTTDECCKISLKNKCSIQRSKIKLPEMFEDSWGSIFRSVTTIDYSKDIQPIKYSEWIRKIENPNSKYDNTIYCFFRNGYLYFPNSIFKTVIINGYFKDDVLNDECSDLYEPCKSILQSIWRLPSYLQKPTIDGVLQELLTTYLKINPNQEVQITKNPN